MEFSLVAAVATRVAKGVVAVIVVAFVAAIVATVVATVVVAVVVAVATLRSLQPSRDNHQTRRVSASLFELRRLGAPSHSSAEGGRSNTVCRTKGHCVALTPPSATDPSLRMEASGLDYSRAQWSPSPSPRGKTAAAPP